MRFPYYRIGITDYAPIITLKILGLTGWLDLEAYIDSGASFSIFNTDRADILGLNYKKGRRLNLTVGDGGLIEVYLHNLQVEIAKTQFLATVGFSKQLGVDFNLLGRKSFFEKFQICFNDKQKFVEFHQM